MARRMIAQPAVHVRDGFAIDGAGRSPVARAIVEAWRCPINAARHMCGMITRNVSEPMRSAQVTADARRGIAIQP
jgi:hypothetical protein